MRRNGHTLAQLALALGVTTRTVTRWRNGESRIRRSVELALQALSNSADTASTELSGWWVVHDLRSAPGEEVFVRGVALGTPALVMTYEEAVAVAAACNALGYPVELAEWEAGPRYAPPEDGR
jgi:hypothetical protein